MCEIICAPSRAAFGANFVAAHWSGGAFSDDEGHRLVKRLFDGQTNLRMKVDNFVKLQWEIGHGDLEITVDLFLT